MAVLSEYLCIRKEMKVIKLDHSLHIDDLSDDSDFEEHSDNKPLLKHQINKLNVSGDPSERDTFSHKVRVQTDDQSYQVKIV